MKMKNVKSLICLAVCVMGSALHAQSTNPIELVSDKLKLKWEKQDDGWHLTEAAAKSETGWLALPSPSGRYTVIYINRNPSKQLTEVDREGLAYPFFPSDVEKQSDGKLVFKQKLPFGELTAEWSLDPKYPSNAHVNLSLKMTEKGSVSIASPTLGVFSEDSIGWGMVPGNWYGSDVQPNFELSPTYSQGLPNRAYLAQEKNSMTLCPLISTKSGLTLGVIPDPECANDPWESKESTRDVWKLGLSTMDRYGQLTPVIYRPVLGQAGWLMSPARQFSLDIDTRCKRRRGFRSFDMRPRTFIDSPICLTFRHRKSRYPIA
ncbi:MAG: hypothetical protein QM811_18905 [Pirellulales bacterium]